MCDPSSIIRTVILPILNASPALAGTNDIGTFGMEVVDIVLADVVSHAAFKVGHLYSVYSRVCKLPYISDNTELNHC